MTYEKKYKEALKEAKKLYGKYCIDNVLEKLFPELKESEDERMLREIKRYIKEQGDKPTGLPNGTVAVSDMIAWLEKQGEQKPNSQMEKCINCQFVYTGYCDGACILKNNERKEPDWTHHRVNLSDYTEFRKAYYDSWNNRNMQHSQKENEDNCVIRCLINGLRFYYADNENATWGTDKFHMKVTDIINWLEKQKTFNEVTEECERTLCEHLKKKYEL